VLPNIRRRRPDSRVEKVRSLNGTKQHVLLLARSGLSLDDAIAKAASIHTESVTSVDSYFAKMQATFDVAKNGYGYGDYGYGPDGKPLPKKIGKVPPLKIGDEHEADPAELPNEPMHKIETLSWVEGDHAVQEF
jgi:hypothetical protein